MSDLIFGKTSERVFTSSPGSRYVANFDTRPVWSSVTEVSHAASYTRRKDGEEAVQFEDAGQASCHYDADQVNHTSDSGEELRIHYEPGDRGGGAVDCRGIRVEAGPYGDRDRWCA